MSKRSPICTAPTAPPRSAGSSSSTSSRSTASGYLPLNTERPTSRTRTCARRSTTRSTARRTRPRRGRTRHTVRPVPAARHAGLRGHPGLPGSSGPRAARDLADWHPGDPLRPITVYYRIERHDQPGPGPDRPPEPDRHRVRSDHGRLRRWRTSTTRSGHRGAPFDLAVSVGWCSDYPDPWNFIQLLDGTTIHDGPGNINWSYFNDPVFNDRMHAAEDLIGDERYDAFQQIEHDLVRDPAPWASMRTYNNRYLFSKRIGCHHYLTVLRHRPRFSSACVLRSRPTTRSSSSPTRARPWCMFPCA